jgi:hypothetical protein
MTSKDLFIFPYLDSLSKALSISINKVVAIFETGLKPETMSCRSYGKVVLSLNEIFKRLKIKVLKMSYKFDEGFVKYYRSVGNKVFHEVGPPLVDNAMMKNVINFLYDNYFENINTDNFDITIFDEEISVVTEEVYSQEVVDRMNIIKDWAEGFISFCSKGECMPSNFYELYDYRSVGFLDKVQALNDGIPSVIRAVTILTKDGSESDLSHNNFDDIINNKRLWFTTMEMNDVQKHYSSCFCRIINGKGCRYPILSKDLKGLITEYLDLVEEKFKFRPKKVVTKKRDLRKAQKEIVSVYNTLNNNTRKTKRKNATLRLKEFKVPEKGKNRFDFYKLIDSATKECGKPIRIKEIFKLSIPKIEIKAFQIAKYLFSMGKVIYDLDIKTMSISIKRLTSEFYNDICPKEYNEMATEKLRASLYGIFEETIKEYNIEDDICAQRSEYLRKKIESYGKKSIKVLKSTILNKIDNRTKRLELSRFFYRLSDRKFSILLATNVIIGYIPKQLAYFRSSLKKVVSKVMKLSSIYN